MLRSIDLESTFCSMYTTWKIHSYHQHLLDTTCNLEINIIEHEMSLSPISGSHHIQASLWF